MDPFVSFLRENAGLVNDYLDGFFRGRAEGPELERYLYGPMEAFTANAGKRHRPLICMLACRAVGGRFEDTLAAAAAIENFQSAALVHDDIADEGELRRGKPCLHRTEGIGVALNCGDLGLVDVFGGVLADAALPDGVKLAVLGELYRMCVRTIEGQALDLGWARDERFDLSVDDYLQMATHKTAYYSGAVPLAVGAIVGGGTEEQVEALRQFGLKAGLAFQIQDDLLNLVGERGAADKDFRCDITEGKRTLVVVKALEDPAVAAHLEPVLRAHEQDPAVLDQTVSLLEDCGAIGYARAYAQGLARDAKAALGGIELRREDRELLLAMADFFVSRTA